MKLIEALKTLNGMKCRKGEELTYFLATGLSPLHLKTFLTAELGLHFTGQAITIRTGLYGDFLGNLDRLADADADTAILLIEWSDLDPRFGIRSSVQWTPDLLADILSTVRARASQIQRAIEETSIRLPLVVCFPTLSLPPLSFIPGWQSSSFELEVKSIVQSLSSKASQCGQVRVLSSQRLDLISPLKQRFDVESELRTGFPYKLPHASALAALLACLVRNPTPKKGLITDLDDTLWRGILGETGIDGISWDLDHHSQMHAFYQRLLGALSAEGVLIGVASKNDRSLVEEALCRSDLVLSRSGIFPIEASWGRKSQAVGRILETWNVGPESVVFVDDSPMELAEVGAAYPQVECIQFPTNDDAAIYDVVVRLRDLFGKCAILEEDSLRVESIRHLRIVTPTRGVANETPTAFLDHAEAETSFSFTTAPLDPRALELVNKTNQFNLNGKRYTETSWRKYFLHPASFLMIASYRDKYGPLGKVGVVAGCRNGTRISIDTWVMSCRAFSRRIEYRCLEELFTKFDVSVIEFAYMKTEKNEPLREFFSDILGAAPWPGCSISRPVFEECLRRSGEPQKVTNE